MKTTFLILIMIIFSQILLSQNILTIMAHNADDRKLLPPSAQGITRWNFVFKEIRDMRFRMQLVFKNSFKFTECRNR